MCCRTLVNILGHQLFGQLCCGVGIQLVPVGVVRSGYELCRALCGNGDGADYSLSCLALRERDDEFAVFCLGIDNLFQGTVMPRFSPDVEVVDEGLAVHGNVKQTHALAVAPHGAAFAHPRLIEVKLNAVFAVGHGQFVAQQMLAVAAALEQYP